MESLNKHQLILLALLVSFVTSIATGIVTVSLMDQAPPGVTQTINRVVEKTIERVVTEPNSQSAAVGTRETIVVKEDEAVITAIEKNTKSIVRIKEVVTDGSYVRHSFAGIGLIVSNEGYIVSDISVAYRKSDASGNSIPESYIGVFPDGKVFPLNIAYSDHATGVMFFQAMLPDSEKETYRFVPPKFGETALKLGQAVVALGGEETNAVSTGIISNLIEREAVKSIPATTAPEKILFGIKTDIRAAELVPGGVLLNLSGEVIGMNVGTVAVSRSIFIPVTKLLQALAKAVPQPTDKKTE